MMIESFIYADESGIHGDDARYCLIVGWLGSARQWKHFEKDWIKLLRSEGVPTFHSRTSSRLGEGGM
jgi:hypothetical protein